MFNKHILRFLLSATLSCMATPIAVNNTHLQADPGFVRCNTAHVDASVHFKNTIRELHRRSSDEQELDEMLSPQLQERAATINVNTYVHLLTDVSSAAMIKQSDVINQIMVMNQAYNPYGLNLVLKGTTATINNAWSIGAGSDMDAAKRALRQGTYADFNLYIHTNLTGGILGTCTMPTNIPAGLPASAYFSDGCNIHAGTLPGGPIYGYNMGLTAVHEAGHWFGLLHTFEGDSCTGDGDYIGDTRQESVSTDGCPTSPSKNSCPSLAGVDPIHNYMDYSTDACYQSFSWQQSIRMRILWQLYRMGK